MKTRSDARTQNVSHVILEGLLTQGNQNVYVDILLDCGATACFIDQKTAGLLTQKVLVPAEKLSLFDGNETSSGKISHVVQGWLSIMNHKEENTFRVTKLGAYDIVLGLPWLKSHNPNIDWEKQSLSFSSTFCKNHCLQNHTLNASLKLDPEELERRAMLKVGAGKLEKSTEEMVPAFYHQYLKTFDRTEAETLPPHRPYDCKLELEEDFKPKNAPVYPMSELELRVLKEYIDGLVKKGYIRPSDSRMASPLFFAKIGNGEIRPVVDYRYINQGTKKDKYPIPLTSQLVERLKGAKWFSKLDLRVGYNQVRMQEGDEWKTAFNCRYGKFEYLVMPLGLCNAPAVFQRFMNDILHDLIDEGIVIYLDDILIYSDTLEGLRTLTIKVIECLIKHHLFLKPEKCEWEQTSVKYLGLIVSSDGLQMDEDKTCRIADWPAPTNVKRTQEFLGFANFYRRFIPNFSKICRPIFNLLQKKIKFVWAESHKKAFNELKEQFTKSPLLLYPDHEKQFFLETDASDYATGGVLTQMGPDSQRHPVSFHSKSLSPAERNYDIYDKELLAIIRVLEEWRHHLEGSPHKVIVLTDHKNLEYFLKTKSLTRRQARWAEIVSTFDLVIQYSPGKSNSAPDALSRRGDHIPEGAPELTHTIFTPEHFAMATTIAIIDSEEEILREIQEAYPSDEKTGSKITYLKTKGAKIHDTTWTGKYLKYRNKIWVPQQSQIHKKILRLYHDSKPAGHPGVKGTLELVSRSYYWPGMSQFITSYVEGCDLCQRIKITHHPKYGKLEPLPVPKQNWTDITYDFIGELPESEGKNAILTVVDRKTKAAHFIPCKTSETAKSTARLFLDNVWKLHGTPERTVSDRGTQFNSEFLRRLYELLGIKPGFSTAYHPETDGQSERINQIVEDYLRFFISHRQNDWVELLPIAEFKYNNTVSNSTGQSPFMMMYGYHPSFTISSPKEELIPAAETLATRLREIHEEAEAMLKISIERYKEQADKKRAEQPPFEVGDKVWLNRKHIKTDRPTEKLDYRRLGPYKITELVGKRAARLELPLSMKIHNVFHVSLLEKWKPDLHGRNPIPLPPVVTPTGEEEWEVEKVLNSKIERGKMKFLVKWKGYSLEENSWEPESNLENAKDAIEIFYSENPNATKKKNTIIRQT